MKDSIFFIHLACRFLQHRIVIFISEKKVHRSRKQIAGTEFISDGCLLCLGWKGMDHVLSKRQRSYKAME